MKTKQQQASHTPGPWMWKENTDGTFSVEIDNGKSAYIGTVADEISKETDASLIAAAPELLEHLKDLRNWFSDMAHYGGIENDNVRQGFINRLALVDSLIAKAEGLSK